MSSYPSSSEFVCGDDANCEAIVPVRDASVGPPLPRDRFERACLRVYAGGPLSLCITVNLNTGVRVVHEVVSFPRSILPSLWDILDILRAQEAQEFAELWAHRRVERLLRLGRGTNNVGTGCGAKGRARGLMPRFPEPLPLMGRGRGRQHG
ncbi:hypothetical protein EAG_11053 [Camponotus floridanus]|uniref:Uncharacterized protein n=1 Tax=Camponotus floridanus TaxID=104421 RepID=E2ALW1_CAMFO|nr:hypothetical protein EAG_11053 [Camponotus floridanus]